MLKKIKLIRIPKTGGKLVRKLLVKNNLFINVPSHPCCNKKFTGSVRDKHFLYSKINFDISIIRNPFNWLYSYYNHKTKSHSGWNNCNNIHSIIDFKDFIIKYTNPEFKWHTPSIKHSMITQICNDKGEIVPKKLIYFEKLPMYFEKNYNIKVSSFKNSDYRKFYDSEMVDLVQEKMKLEFHLFPYSFDKIINTDNNFFEVENNKKYIKI